MKPSGTTTYTNSECKNSEGKLANFIYSSQEITLSGYSSNNVQLWSNLYSAKTSYKLENSYDYLVAECSKQFNLRLFYYGDFHGHGVSTNSEIQSGTGTPMKTLTIAYLIKF